MIFIRKHNHSSNEMITKCLVIYFHSTATKSNSKFNPFDTHTIQICMNMEKKCYIRGYCIYQSIWKTEQLDYKQEPDDPQY